MEARPSPGGAQPPRPWALLLMLLVVVLSVLVPFSFWHGTWFGRPLTDDELGRRLADTQGRPRRTQHALAQIAERIVQADPTVRRWYPQVVTLASHPVLELRATVAWVMGQDSQSPEFHQALVRLLDDPAVLVRRNAALSLVRFGDARGRPELLNMLRPYTLRAAQPGLLRFRLQVDDTVNPGTLVARIHRAPSDVVEVRSPIPGHLEARLVAEESHVRAGDAILLLAPGPDEVWEALRALYLVGEAEDLPEVERFARGVAGMPDKIQQQARLTSQAIRSRSSQTRQGKK